MNTIHECDKCGMYFHEDESGAYWHPCEKRGLTTELKALIGVFAGVLGFFALLVWEIGW